MKLILGSDHAGLTYKNILAKHLHDHGYQVAVVGAESTHSYDYPNAADLVAERVISGEFARGILICGSGVGVCIRANRYPGIRAANCNSPEIAALARQHNHINVLCLGERQISIEAAKNIVEAFLNTTEDLEERHIQRVKKLDQKID